MAKLDLSNISETITEEHLISMVEEAKKNAGHGNLTAIKVTSTQHDNIKGFRDYKDTSTSVTESGDDYIGDVDTLPTPEFREIDIEEV